MNNELEGTVKLTTEVETFASGFKKRTIVVTTDDKYPQDIAVDFVQDKTDLLNGISAGDTVTIHFNIRGSEYKGKYYVNLSGWKIDASSKAAEESLPGIDEQDDVPF